MAKCIRYTHYEVDGDELLIFKGEKLVDAVKILEIIEDWLEESVLTTIAPLTVYQKIEKEKEYEDNL
ncbi:MAG: hypothetical protein Q8O10_10275 [candidate division Zixibacteria bacterium]|nr:hypothetical protein [candidate division Zixibacteria bacterium]